MGRSLGLLAVIFACAPATVRAPETRAPVAVAPVKSAKPAVEPAERSPLDGLLKPWHRVEAGWWDAPVQLLTQYRAGNSCEVQEDGAMVMYTLDRFIIGHVLRGEVTAREVTLDGTKLKGASYPRAFVEGQRYLVFLRPGALGTKILGKADGTGLLQDRLGPDEVVAVVDLDAREEEVEAEAVVATRAGEHAGFRLDPVVWQALRTATKLDAGQLRAVVGFLEAVVLRGQAPLADTRAWLGPPDYQELLPSGSRVDHYVLARGVVEEKKRGSMYATLTLAYDGGLRLQRAKLEYDEMQVRTGVYVAKEFSPRELARRKLPVMNLQWATP